jgi:hypothetical protein
LLAEAAAAGTGQSLKIIDEGAVRQAFNILGAPTTGWFQFQTLYSKIVKDQPDLLD